jgi:hypothetical protein
MVAPLPIDPTSIYDDGSVSLNLGIPDSVLAKARREGRLRFTRQGRRVLYLGRWLLEWLERASVDTAKPAEVPSNAK